MGAPGGCQRIGLVLWKVYFHMMFGVFSVFVYLKTKLLPFCLHRRLLGVWRENAVLSAEMRRKEQRAERHFQLCLQIKV